MSLVRVQQGEPKSYTCYSPLVQLVERWTVNPYVAGSSPAGGANALIQKFYSPLVQLVERWTVNPYVAGSSPAGGAS
jgi:hypothetical protein